MQYYFGSAATEPPAETTESATNGFKNYKEEEEEKTTPKLDDDLEFTEVEDMELVSPRNRSVLDEKLKSITELNYEASSDEEGLLNKVL